MVRGETLTPQSVQDVSAQDGDKHAPIKTNERNQPSKPRTKIISDDVVLHVSAVEVADKNEQVIHLSLDDNKPKRVSKTNVTPKPKAEPSHDAPSLEAPSPAMTDAVIADTTTADTVELSTPAAAHEDAHAYHQPAQATAFSISAEQIALAEQTQRAINDPRVVQAYHAKPTASTPITGSAGEFITRVLGVRSESFVADFLRALAQAQHPAVATDFDFTNYGYIPLSDDTLSQFHADITADGHFATTQGKTAVTPRPLTKRAINDPRGQHPDHQNITDTPVKTDDVSADDTIVADGKVPTDDITPVVVPDVPSDTSIRTKPKAKATKDDVASVSVAVQEVEQTDQQSAKTNIELDAKPVSQPTFEPSVATTVVDIADKVMTTKLDLQGDEGRTESPIKATTGTTIEAKTKQDAASRYKDMIESVSGQLLQSTSILSLVAPKKPRTPKPKAPKATKSPTRKTSKIAQKSEVIKKKPATDNPISDDDTPSIS